jgi:hypothetical protein
MRVLMRGPSGRVTNRVRISLTDRGSCAERRSLEIHTNWPGLAVKRFAAERREEPCKPAGDGHPRSPSPTTGSGRVVDTPSAARSPAEARAQLSDGRIIDYIEVVVASFLMPSREVLYATVRD